MPKIRGVKPDLWTDEDFVELSPFARLLWIGMWNYCCDNGHVADKSKQIKMRVLPTDDVNVAELLRELEARKRIERDGGWITIPNFSRHQKPDLRYWTTCEMEGCEPPPETIAQRKSRRAPAVHTTGTPGVNDVTTSGAHVDGEVKGSEGDGERTRAGRATAIPPEWRPSEKHRALAAELGVDPNAEAMKFRDHAIANGKTFKDWEAGFRTWLRNAPTFGGRVTPIRPTPTTDDQGRVQLPPLPGNFWDNR